MNSRTSDTERELTMVTTTHSCAACGLPMAESLSRLGSVRCHDCRDIDAPVRSQLVTHSTPARELAHRSGDGLEVTLLWFEATGQIAVRVLDSRSGDRFEVRVDPSDALDAYRHPFAYATPRRAETEELVYVEAA
jgi:hypothetical protein